MKKAALVLVAVFFAAGLAAQDTGHTLLQSTPKIRRKGLPTVTFKTDNQLLMKAFYPEYYANEYKIRKDIRWVRRNDSSLAAMWDSLGDTVLAALEDLSGIKWRERKLDIRILKYLRVDVLYDPLAIPLKGIKMEHYIEAAPTGLHRFLNLVKILAGRNLLQAELLGFTRLPISSHPLLDKSAYRFDVVALTLALACAEQVLPPDSLRNILDSELWQRHNPGWEIYDNHFRYSWLLSPEQTLVTYLLREPYDSPLVGLTRPPRITKPESKKEYTIEPIILSAGGGRCGFSVAKTPTGLLEVVDIDTLGLAYSCGLMTGDRIKRVNGQVVRNARELMGRILDKLDTDGIYMIIVREGEEMGLLFLPPEEY